MIEVVFRVDCYGRVEIELLLFWMLLRWCFWGGIILEFGKYLVFVVDCVLWSEFGVGGYGCVIDFMGLFV